MASMFSGALQLTDLNDFITPSQECIKPVQVLKKDNKKGTSVVVSEDGEYFETNEEGVKEKLEKAKITLNDCLACSGCITSAESILITQQSQEELYRVIKENKKFQLAGDVEKLKILVVSLSPQSSVSLAAKYKLDLQVTTEKLTSFFHKLGVRYVFDTTLSRDFSLLEIQKEFLHRYKTKDIEQGNLPLLTSACPGWVCYAEKTHGDYILPYISSVKSPQQIIGSLVKDYLARNLNKSPNQIYHITVMPCYDKKLEASRSDFYSEVYETRDVDCVLTSIEVDAMLQSEHIDLNELPCEKMDGFSVDSPHQSEYYTHTGSTSGGYSDHVFLHAAKELFGESVSNVSYKTLRNQDLKEVILERDGEVVLKFAIANGFRNIQNIVQKLKRGKSPYHFVEVMACPSGCINGGAQIRAVEESPKELILKMEDLYHSLPTKDPEENTLVKYLYEDWLGGEDTPKAKQMLHTQYHAVEKMKNALFIKW